MISKTAQWIEQNINHVGSDCLIWPFGRDSGGYARACVRGYTTRLAHRIMCQKVNGLPPFGGAVARHKCGNGHKGCVNPNHLEWGSVADNNKDKCEAGKQPKGPDIGRAVLNEEKVYAIRKMAAEGLSQRKIASEIGVHHTTVQAVIQKRTWGHVEDRHGVDWKETRRSGLYGEAA